MSSSCYLFAGENTNRLTMKIVNLAALTAGIVTTTFISPSAIGREAPLDMRHGHSPGADYVVSEKQTRAYQNSHQQPHSPTRSQNNHRFSHGMGNTPERTFTESTRRHYTPKRTINDNRNSVSAARPDTSSEHNYRPSISNGSLSETINNPDINSILEQERQRKRRASNQKIRRKLNRMMSKSESAKKFRANLDSNSLGNSFSNSF